MAVPQEYWFDHEKLDVYQEAIAFIAWLSGSWKARCESATSRINWTGHPLRFRSISPRATANIAEGSLPVL